MVEQVICGEKLISIIIRNEFNKPGITFFTPNDFSQQVAFMKHSNGQKIYPHIHNPVKREVYYTQEVLIIKDGKLRVDFYNENRQYFESRVLAKGDIILLVSGGHGFEVLEDLEMIEIKQGPFAGELDKTRFEAVPDKFNIK